MRPSSPFDQPTTRMGIDTSRLRTAHPELCTTQPTWSCYYCCIEIPYQMIMRSSCCTCVDFCNFIYCYDYFDGTGDYNLTSCRKNTYDSYCDSMCNNKTIGKRILGCIGGPCYYWPVMVINCFNLIVIKNIDRCCICIQERYCYKGKCCHSKRIQIQIDHQTEIWKQENRRMDQEEESSQTGFSFHGEAVEADEPMEAVEADEPMEAVETDEPMEAVEPVENQPPIRVSDSYAEYPPRDEGHIPPPYPEPKFSKI